jgi:hypothetical protein
LSLPPQAQNQQPKEKIRMQPAIVSRTGLIPMDLVIKKSRFLKVQLWASHKLIRLAYRIAGVRFQRPAKITRADKRRVKHAGRH